jgi:hypothetical protein
MADEQSIVVIAADSAEVARVERATERERALQLEATSIVEAIPGLFASGKWGAAVVGEPDCARSSQIQAFSAGVQRNPRVACERKNRRRVCREEVRLQCGGGGFHGH